MYYLGKIEFFKHFKNHLSVCMWKGSCFYHQWQVTQFFSWLEPAPVGIPAESSLTLQTQSSLDWGPAWSHTDHPETNCEAAGMESKLSSFIINT